MPEASQVTAGEQDVFLRIESGSHTAEITQVLVTSDRKRLVSCGQDKSIRIWNAQTLKEERKILGWIEADESGQIQSIALSPDDRYLVAAVRVEGWQGILRLHDFESGKILKTFNPHSEQAPGTGILAFSPDCEYFFCAEGRSIKMWRWADVLDRETPQPVASIEAFRPQEICYYTAGKDRRLAWVELNGPLGCVVYSLDQNRRVGSFSPPERYNNPHDQRKNRSFFSAVAASERYIAVNGDYSYVWIFDLDLNPVARFPQSADYPNTDWSKGIPTGLDFSPDGKLLLVGEQNSAHSNAPVQARVYDVEAGFKPLGVSPVYDTPATAVAFLDDKTAVSAGGSRSEIHVWDAPSGEAQGRIHGAGKIAFTVSMRDGVIGFGNTRGDKESAAPFERAFNLAHYGTRGLNPSEAKTFQPIPTTWQDYRLGIPPDNDNLFLFNPSGRIPLTGSPGMYRARIGWYGATIYGFSASGEIIVGSRGGQVYLLDRDGNYRAILDGHTGFVHGMAVWRGKIGEGHEITWLVTSGEDQTIRLWNLDEIPAETDPTAPPEFEPALNLFIAFEEEKLEWILWNGSGYYDASLGGDHYIGYHVTRGEGVQADFYHSHRFIKELYRPYFIRCILEMGSLDSALSDAHLDKPKIAEILPPTIELSGPAERTSDEDSIEIAFEVRPAADTVQRTWIVCNDAFVWQKRSKFKARPKRFSAPVKLGPGKNHIKILAESKTAKSNPVQVTVEHTPRTEPPPTFRGPVQTPTQPAETLQVRFDLAGEGNSLHGLRLVRDGKKVWEQGDESAAKDGTISIPIEAADGEYILQTDLKIPAEGSLKNMLSLSISRSPATQAGAESGEAEKSRGDASEAGGSEQEGESKPYLYILAVGVSKIAHPLPQNNIIDLDFADADARSIVDEFKTQQGKRYEKVISYLLTNEDATREEVYKALEKLEKKANKRARDKLKRGDTSRDVSLIFLAGHGVQNPATGDYYFWTHDFNKDDLPDTGLHLIDFGLRITSLPTELIIMTDACRSGLVGREIIRNLDPEALAKRLIALNETAQIIFNATEKDTSSFERNGHGYFTHGILDSLNDGSRSQIPVLWLIDNVQDRVIQLSRGRQIPTARFYGDIYREIIYERL